MDYPKKTLTRDGAALLANDDADGYNTVIDHVITSDELPDSSEELDDIEVGDFHNPVKIKIDSYQHQGATFQPEATWDNAIQTIKSEYPIQMFGLLAHGANDNDSDETLLAVAVADGAPFIMPATNKVPFTFTMALTLTYSNASNVTADVDDTNAVTNEELVNKLKARDKSNSQTYETVVNVKSDVNSLANADSSLKADVTNLSNHAEATFEASANASSAHGSLSSQINSVSSAANTSITQLSNSDNATFETINNANSAHSSLTDSANGAHNSLQAKITSLQTDLDSNFDTISEANASYSSLMNNADSLKNSIQSLNSNLGSDTVNELNSLTSNINSFNTTTQSLSAQINNVSSAADNEITNVSNNDDTNYDNLSTSLNGINGNIGYLNNSCSSLSGAINNTNDNINSHPSWDDENWTRNNVVPSAATNALNQANAYTNSKIQLANNQTDAQNKSRQNNNVLYIYPAN